MTTALILLGNGTPNLEHDRYQSGYALLVNDRLYLVDCGGGVMQRFSAAQHQYQVQYPALTMSKLTHLFLTHLHPDHTVGLADFLIHPWVAGRSDTVHIYGSDGTQAMIDHLLQAYSIGIGEHREGIAPINNPLNIDVHPMRDDVIHEDEHVCIRAFSVQHGELEAYGLKFVTDDKTIVFSGDTVPLPEVFVEHAADCDILVHEVYSATQFQSRSPAWQAYHRQAHTSTTDLADLAKQVQPKKLILTHQLLWGITPEALTQELSDLYAGDIIYGRDLMLIE